MAPSVELPRSAAGYLYILGTVLFTVYGQLVLKWQVRSVGALPADVGGIARYMGRLLANPWIVSSFGAGFLAFLCWAAAMTKFELSYAYPFMSASFVLVMVMSALVFHETVTPAKVVGLAFIVIGIIVASRG
jgi:multidrug transporter EmrE-like cation transporter